MAERKPKIGDVVEYVWPNYPPANGAIGQVFEYIPDNKQPEGYRYYVRWDFPPPNYAMSQSGESADHLRVVCPSEAIEYA